MPRNVRNSWVQVRVDGRSTTDETGPRGKDGTMRARFYVRHDDQVKESVSVETFARSDGELSLRVYHPELGHVLSDTTQRDDNMPERRVELEASTRAMLSEVHDRVLLELYAVRDDQEIQPTPQGMERARKLAHIERAVNDLLCDLEAMAYPL